MRAIIDRDVFPRRPLLDSLPDDWEVSTRLRSAPDDVRTDLDGVDVAFITSRIPMPRSVIEDATDLKIIAKLGTGIDNIDCDAAAEHEIAVTHTPGHNALSVAEHTIALTLATSRRFTEARNLLERGAWRDEYPLGSRLSGSTVGIIGFGNVGKRVGSLLSGFNVDLLVHDPCIHRIDVELVNGSLTGLSALLDHSDVVIVTTELTEETHGLIGNEELDRMGDDTILVNTARGPVIDEQALLDALQAGEIAGAGLDVFETEPLDDTSPFLALENVVLTPHIAAMTLESRTEGIERLVTNVNNLLEGTQVPERYLATPPR